MLTEEGQNLVVSSMLSRIERVGNVVLFVGDGSSEVEQELDAGFPRVEGGSIVFQATFGPGEANFEWRREGIRVDGQTIESEDVDAGRKATGSTWTTQVTIDLAPAT